MLNKYGKRLRVKKTAPIPNTSGGKFRRATNSITISKVKNTSIGMRHVKNVDSSTVQSMHSSTTSDAFTIFLKKNCIAFTASPINGDGSALTDITVFNSQRTCTPFSPYTRQNILLMGDTVQLIDRYTCQSITLVLSADFGASDTTLSFDSQVFTKGKHLFRAGSYLVPSFLEGYFRSSSGGEVSYPIGNGSGILTSIKPANDWGACGTSPTTTYGHSFEPSFASMKDAIPCVSFIIGDKDGALNSVSLVFAPKTTADFEFYLCFITYIDGSTSSPSITQIPCNSIDGSYTSGTSYVKELVPTPLPHPLILNTCGIALFIRSNVASNVLYGNGTAKMRMWNKG